MSLKLKLIFTQKHTRNWKKIFKKISYRDSMAKQPHKGHKPPTISTFWSKLQIWWNVITLTYPEFQIFFFKPVFLFYIWKIFHNHNNKKCSTQHTGSQETPHVFMFWIGGENWRWGRPGEHASSRGVTHWLTHTPFLRTAAALMCC